MCPIIFASVVNGLFFSTQWPFVLRHHIRGLKYDFHAVQFQALLGARSGLKYRSPRHQKKDLVLASFSVRKEEKRRAYCVGVGFYYIEKKKERERGGDELNRFLCTCMYYWDPFCPNGFEPLRLKG